MKSETITLREEHSGEDFRNLWACITENGDLIIEGLDFGPAVGEFWGDGLLEYEWDITVRAAHIPKLIATLGGKDGDNVLSLLAERYSEDPRCASKSFLEERGILIAFSHHVGD